MKRQSPAISMNFWIAALLATLAVAAVLAIAPGSPASAQTRTLSSTSFKGGDGSYDRVVKEGKLGKVALAEVYCYYHMRATENPPDTNR